jgi:hypothetical protein
MLGPLARRAAASPRARALTSFASELAAGAASVAASVLKPVGAGYAITLALALTL